MRITFQALSVFFLCLLILPPILFLAGNIPLDQTKFWMLIATAGWFVITPLWMGRESTEEESETATE